MQVVVRCERVSHLDLCTLERQSLCESHRQRRWLTCWSYERLSPRIRPNEVQSLTLIFYSRPIEPVVGPMQTLLWRMKYPPKKSSSSRNVLSKRVLKLLCIANR